MPIYAKPWSISGIFVAGFLVAAATGCSFDAGVGLDCEDGDYKGGLLCEDGEWVPVDAGGADGGTVGSGGGSGSGTAGTSGGVGSASDGSGSSSGSGTTGATGGTGTSGTGTSGTTGQTGGDAGQTGGMTGGSSGSGGSGTGTSGDVGVRDAGPDAIADAAGASVGSSCRRDADCASGDCRNFDGVSRCTASCSSGGCPPADMVCSQGICMPDDYCDDSAGPGYGSGPGCKAMARPCSNCAPNASCQTQSDGSKTCVCNQGFAGDGTSCGPDADGDGLRDKAERNIHGTDPKRADTDRDGLSDGEEIKTYKTDPKAVDSDGDYLPDGAEVGRHKTDPAAADTDGGGRADGLEELIFKSNPNSGGDDGKTKPEGKGAAATLVDDRRTTIRDLKAAEDTFYTAEPQGGEDGVLHFGHDAPINFASSNQTKGVFRSNDFRLEGSKYFDGRVSNITGVFSGLIWVPKTYQTASWAVGSEDGFRLRIHDGQQLQVSKYDGLRPGNGSSIFDTGPLLHTTMPRPDALYPFEVLFFAEPGDEGVEFSWVSGKPPFKAPPYRLVPAAHIAAPELKVDYEMSVVGGGDLSGGSTVEWKVTIENKGRAYAWSVLYVPRTGRGRLRLNRWTKLPARAEAVQTQIWGRSRPSARLSYLAPGQKVELVFEGTSGFGYLEGASHVFAAASPLTKIDERRLRVYEDEVLGD